MLPESQDESLLMWLLVAIWREGRASRIGGVALASNGPALRGLEEQDGDREQQGAERLSGESRVAKVRMRAGNEKRGSQSGPAVAGRGSCPTTRWTPEPVLILLSDIWRSRDWGALPPGCDDYPLHALENPHGARGLHSLPGSRLLSDFSPSKSIFISNHKRQSQSR